MLLFDNQLSRCAGIVQWLAITQDLHNRIGVFRRFAKDDKDRAGLIQPKGNHGAPVAPLISMRVVPLSVSELKVPVPGLLPTERVAPCGRRSERRMIWPV